MAYQATVKAFLLLLISANTLLAGPTLMFKSRDGQVLEAELVAIGEKQCTVRRASDGMTFDLPFDRLDEDSVKQIEKNRESIGPRFPDYECSVSINRRSRKQRDSYYMRDETISATVEVENPDREIPSPAVNGRLLIFGQDQRNTRLFKVIGVEDFKAAPKPLTSQEFEMKPVVTSYDSDNKGEGNIGGFKYDGYVMVLYDSKNRPVYFKTLTPTFQRAIEKDGAILEILRTIAVEAPLDEDLKPY